MVTIYENQRLADFKIIRISRTIVYIWNQSRLKFIENAVKTAFI